MFEDHGQDEVDLTQDEQVAGKGSSSVAPGGSQLVHGATPGDGND